MKNEILILSYLKTFIVEISPLILGFLIYKIYKEVKKK